MIMGNPSGHRIHETDQYGVGDGEDGERDKIIRNS